MTGKFMPSNKEIDYVTKRAREGASNTNIATELEYQLHVKRTVEEVTLMRDKLNLPKEDFDTSIRAMTTSSAGLEHVLKNPPKMPPQKKLPISAAAVTRKFKKPADAVKVEQVETPEKAERTPIKVKFTPEPVKKCIVGETYIIANTGAMQCIGVDTQTYGGHSVETAKMKQMYVEKGAVTNAIPVARLASVARKVASPAVMQEIMHKIECGLHGLKGIPSVSPRLAPYFEERIKELDINTLADLVCYFYAAPGKESTSLAQNFGDRAIKLIASEYAHVMKDDYAKVVRRITDILGRTTAEPVIPRGAHEAPEGLQL